MKNRQVAWIILALLAAAALGALIMWRLSPVEQPEAPTQQPVPTATPTQTPEPQPAEKTAVRIYLTRGEELGVAGRSLAASQNQADLARRAVEALMEGPSAEESEWGLSTAVPIGTEVLGVVIADGTATVDLSGEFASGGGSLSMQMRAAQVVFTLTQFDGVERVSFELDGEPIAALGGEGIDVSEVTRADFEDVVPSVLVETPYPGQEVTSTLVASGTSNVFEATHQLQVTEPEGRIIYDNFVTATSGTGTRGTWSQTVELRQVSREGLGAVIVFEYSAENGQKINTVEIPVRFTE